MPKKSVSPKKRSAKKKSGKRASKTADTTQRLQRYLASAGFGSRRQCEELIEAGRVDVDGTTITKLGATVDSKTQKVRVDGVLLKKQKLVYYAVNKPVGVVTTNRDPMGRPRVVDLVPPDERVFPVGRLDRSSEGLILLTNDGDLAQKLTHPKFGVRKVYRVTVAGKVDTETMRQMRKGIYIAEGFVRVEGAKLLKSRSRSTEMEIVLREGKNREIRRILARLGHKVQQLRRIAVGPLRLGDVPPGAYRVVSSQEVEKLWLATAEPSSDGPPRKGGKKSRGTKTAGKQTKTTNRRPAKKKKPSKNSPEASKERGAEMFSYDGTGSDGAVIGGDAPAPTKRTPRKKTAKRGTKSGQRSGATGGKGRGTKKRSSGKSTKGRSSGGAGTARTSRRGAGKSPAPKRATKKRGGSPKSNNRRRKK
ncbi:MAG: pseudouridine synthase [Rubripirellula sp.]